MLLTTNLLVALLSWQPRLPGLVSTILPAWRRRGTAAYRPTWGRRSRLSQPESPPSCSSSRSRRLQLDRAHRWQSLPLSGTFATTWMVAAWIAHMNSAAVFISLLFWGWLWGVWGMLLSIPIIVIVKVVSQHVEQLHPMAELLGD